MMDSKEFSNGQNESRQELDLDRYVRVLWRRRRTVIRSVLITTSLALLYLFLTTPQYSSDALLKSNPGATEQVGWKEVSDLLAPADDPVSTALEVIVSRRVLGAVVDRLHLDILAQPKFFPLIGAPLSRIVDLIDDDPQDLRASVPGMSRWAWGGERIAVEQFSVPPDFEGESFTLVKGGGQSYQLMDKENNVILSGSLRTVAQGQIELPNGQKQELSILVSELVAHEGTKFSVTKLSRVDAIKILQNDFEAVESAGNSGVIHLSYSNPSATLVANVLNVVATTFVDQSIGDKRERLDLMLAFIDSQLPVVRSNLRVAEDEFNKYHGESGSVDVNLEANSLLTQLVQLEGQISNLALLQIDYQQTYTAEHPIRMALESKIQQLRQEKARLSAKIATLPSNELQSVNVQKEVEIASQVYLQLQQRQQEFSVARAGLIGDFSIVDSAFTPLDIDLLTYVIVPVLAVALGGFIGLVLVLFRRRNLEVVESLEDLTHFQIPILVKIVRRTERPGAVWRIKALVAWFRRRKPTETPGRDSEMEGLGEFRVSLAYSASFREGGLLLLTTPSGNPGVGVVADQLSRLFAASGKTVVLVDADLRNGNLHEPALLASGPGLAEVILDQMDLRNALQKIDFQKPGHQPTGSMSLLSAGRRVSDPAGALMSTAFDGLIESLRQQFDVVVVAAPPLLDSANALPVISAARGSAILIVRAGQHVPGEIEFAMNKFVHRGRKIDGLILYDETSCPKTVA